MKAASGPASRTETPSARVWQTGTPHPQGLRVVRARQTCVPVRVQNQPSATVDAGRAALPGPQLPPSLSSVPSTSLTRRKDRQSIRAWGPPSSPSHRRHQDSPPQKGHMGGGGEWQRDSQGAQAGPLLHGKHPGESPREGGRTPLAVKLHSCPTPPPLRQQTESRGCAAPCWGTHTVTPGTGPDPATSQSALLEAKVGASPG